MIYGNANRCDASDGFAPSTKNALGCYREILDYLWSDVRVTGSDVGFWCTRQVLFRYPATPLEPRTLGQKMGLVVVPDLYLSVDA